MSMPKVITVDVQFKYLFKNLRKSYIPEFELQSLISTAVLAHWDTISNRFSQNDRRMYRYWCVHHFILYFHNREGCVRKNVRVWMVSEFVTVVTSREVVNSALCHAGHRLFYLFLAPRVWWVHKFQHPNGRWVRNLNLPRVPRLNSTPSRA